MLTSALLIVGAYLLGAIPSGYLVGRYLKGIDIRKHGSGNVGATNVMAHVGIWTGLLLGAFDCLAKGSLPVAAAKLLDQSLAVQVGAPLAAIAGHNWSPYLRLTGGRGVATAIGALVGFLMWPELLIIGFVMGLIGRLLLHETGLWTLVSILVAPALAYLAFHRPPEIVYLTLGIGGLLILKRATANWEPIPAGHHRIRVVANRLLWDRDVADKAEWTHRRPPPMKESLSANAGDDLLR